MYVKRCSGLCNAILSDQLVWLKIKQEMEIFLRNFSPIAFLIANGKTWLTRKLCPSVQWCLSAVHLELVKNYVDEIVKSGHCKNEKQLPSTSQFHNTLFRKKLADFGTVCCIRAFYRCCRQYLRNTTYTTYSTDIDLVDTVLFHSVKVDLVCGTFKPGSPPPKGTPIRPPPLYFIYIL